LKEVIILKLDQLSVRDFIHELSSAKAAPGGGSVAALCGALGAALSAMVSRLTKGREKFKDMWKTMEEIQQKADDLAGLFLNLVQKDTDTYQQVMAAIKLPRETDEGKASRQAAIEESMKKATAVPLEILRASEKLIGITKKVVECGNPVALSDAGGALQLARTSGAIAAYNVRINLARIEDEKFVAEHRREVDETLERMETLFSKVDGYMNAHLS
jgi:formiminotetrahydrofolate cyclodeaminase